MLCWLVSRHVGWAVGLADWFQAGGEELLAVIVLLGRIVADIVVVVMVPRGMSVVVGR